MQVVAVAKDGGHRFSKTLVNEIDVVAGQGVIGDAHCGALVKHRSRVRVDPTQPNLRQVHLLHTELFEELALRGFTLAPAQLGENITTRGIDLLGLSRGTLVRIGETVCLEITGLRNPCAQIDAFMPGLLAEVLVRSASGALIRKAGVMSVVRKGGLVRPGDAISVELPEGPHVPLERV